MPPDNATSGALSFLMPRRHPGGKFGVRPWRRGWEIRNQEESLSVGKPQAVTGRDFGVYGLRVRSDINLPDWPTLTASDPDVTICLDAPYVPVDEGEAHTGRAVVEAGQLTLLVHGVARYCAAGGTVIRVAPQAGARPEDVRLYLTGALMGAILHQRGTFPLHASCVVLNGVGIAFAGRSGAGKSTLVAAMVRGGAAFASDDICAMLPVSGGRCLVWPGAARVKLDQHSLAGHPESPSGLPPAGGNRGKFHLAMDGPAEWTTPIPLNKVYLLTDGAGPPRVEPITGLEAISALVDETYFLGYAAALGLTPQVFRLASTVASALQVNRLIRPRGFEHLPSLVAALQQDVHAPTGIS